MTTVIRELTVKLSIAVNILSDKLMLVSWNDALKKKCFQMTYLKHLSTLE